MVIKSDTEVQNHIAKIEAEIPRVKFFLIIIDHYNNFDLLDKKKEMCGGSTFKAARTHSSKYAKSDETGLIMSQCRHGVVLGAIIMHRGETFIHTHFMHILCKQFNCKYFGNDVVCRYSAFAKRVGQILPEYQSLCQEMVLFLPRMHAKAHNWPC